MTPDTSRGTGTTDLHSHSTASDGELPPAGVVSLARSRSIATLALTDHDTLEGIPDASRAGEAAGVEIIPGIELSAQWNGAEVHVLGLFVDPREPRLQSLCRELHERRLDRIVRICARLRSLGIDLSPQEIIASAGRGTVGRPHVARALVAKGHVRGIREAFDRFLATGRRAYVLAHDLEPARAVEVIHAAGGVAGLAHPKTMGDDELVERLGRETGLDALEAHHPEHDRAATSRYRAMASRLGLGICGGSDSHGAGVSSVHAIGGTTLPREDFRDLRERHRRRFRMR